ncbi:MAG: c-type cytochrome [Longimicrobiales bacterium]
MKTLLRLVGGLVLVALVLGIAGYLWVSNAAAQAFDRTVDTHEIDFPIPFPDPMPTPGTQGAGGGAVVATLAAAEAPEEAVDPMAAAIARGEHLVRARYGCADCHGEDFSGGVMMDAMPVARAFGPNLTTGEGGPTRDFTPADWDRAVRHGVGSDGRPLIMPSQDFLRMSDQELADIVAYIRSFPPVDNEVEPVTLGPIGKLLIARGQMRLSADYVEHDGEHPAYPPEAAPTAEFGAHLAGACVGCHKEDFTGGDIGGDPSWAPAANLTGAGRIPDWSLAEFTRVMREGVRPDGTELLEPMTFVVPLAGRMSDVEIEALYRYFQSLPARETGA